MIPRVSNRLLMLVMLLTASLDLLLARLGWTSVTVVLAALVFGVPLACLLSLIRETMESYGVDMWETGPGSLVAATAGHRRHGEPCRRPAPRHHHRGDPAHDRGSPHAPAVSKQGAPRCAFMIKGALGAPRPLASGGLGRLSRIAPIPS